MLRKLPPVASRRSLSTALRSVRQPASGHVVVGGGTSRLRRDGEERQLSGIQCLRAGTEDRALVLGQDYLELVVLLDRSVALAIAASRSAASVPHSADNAASRDDSAITACRSNAGSEGKSLMQSDSTTTPHE